MTNIYDKIKTVRKPRVHISYDIEEGDARVKKELPFVVGVLGDFTGHSTKPLKNFKKRKFINIYGENFNEVMESMNPGVQIKVDNKIANDGSMMSVNLSFKSIEDFSPANIAENVPPLKKLLKIRNNLKELLSKAERSEDFEKALEKILQSEEHLKNLSEIFNSVSEMKEESVDEETTEEQPKQ